MSRVLVAGAWNFTTLGTASLTVTDGGGLHGALSFTTGYYEHKLGIIASSGTINPTCANFGTALEVALNLLAGTQVYTVTQSGTTGRYTIAVDTGTFSIAVNAVAAKLLGAFIGSGTINSTGTSWTGTYVPWSMIIPAKPGLFAYIPPFRQGDAIKERVTSGGDVKRLGPTSVPRLASWQHQFEPKERVDRDWLDAIGFAASTQLYTWEDLWTDYGLGNLPLGMLVSWQTDAADIVEYMTYRLLQATYDDTVSRRRAPNDDSRFHITVKARLWPTTTAGRYARTMGV